MIQSRIDTEFLILGAGLTGLSAACNLKSNYLLVESGNAPGGTSGTLIYKDFRLDNAVHVLYFRNDEIRKWIQEVLNINLVKKNRNSSVFIKGSFVRFPIQFNLSDLSLLHRFRAAASVGRKIVSMDKKEFGNFKEYSESAFGKYLTRIFFRDYNEKLFGVGLEKLNTEWMGDYIPRYSRLRMLLSTFFSSKHSYGRNSEYYYPLDGGISLVSESLGSQLITPPVYNTSFVKLSLRDKKAYFSNSLEIRYKKLINTIPIKSFLSKIEDLPVDIQAASDLLACNPTTILHLLVPGKINSHLYDWIYFPEPSIPFYRATFPGNINPANCPRGKSSITLEFGGKIGQKDKAAAEVMRILKKLNFIEQKTENIEQVWKVLDCGYVIYDRNRKKALEKILPFLNKHNIFSIGRYGNWEYSNMEDAIIHGRKIVDRLGKLG